MIKTYVLIIFCTLIISSLSNAQAIEINEWRVGLGYSYRGETTLLDQELSRVSVNHEIQRQVPALPLNCFNGSGVTAVNDLPVRSRKDILGLVSAFAYMGLDLTLECGDHSIDVSPFIEASEDGTEWFIFNNPTPYFLNIVLYSYLKRTVVSQDDATNTNHNYIREGNVFGSGSVEIIRDSDLMFRMGVVSRWFVVAIPTPNIEVNQYLSEAIKSIEVKRFVVTSTTITGDVERKYVWVRLNKISAEDFFTTAKTATLYALQLSSAAYAVEHRLNEFELRSQDPNSVNWVEGIAQEYLTDDFGKTR